MLNVIILLAFITIAASKTVRDVDRTGRQFHYDIPPYKSGEIISPLPPVFSPRINVPIENSSQSNSTSSGRASNSNFGLTIIDAAGNIIPLELNDNNRLVAQPPYKYPHQRYEPPYPGLVPLPIHPIPAFPPYPPVQPVPQPLVQNPIPQQPLQTPISSSPLPQWSGPAPASNNKPTILIVDGSGLLSDTLKDPRPSDPILELIRLLITIIRDAIRRRRETAAAAANAGGGSSSSGNNDKEDHSHSDTPSTCLSEF